MKIIKMECPNCGARIEVKKEGQTICSHCNASFYAEEKDKEIVVNTTIYNYGHGSKPYEKPSGSIFGRLIRIMLSIALILIATSAVMTNFFKTKSRELIADLTQKEARTAVESSLMIEFCETLFEKSFFDIESADYARLSYIKISEKGRTVSDDYWEMEYRFSDGGEGKLRVRKKSMDEGVIEMEDFQCFINLEELDLSGVSVLERSYYGEAYDLRNLEKLKAFSGGVYTRAEDVLSLFANPESVKKISVSGYDSESGLGKFVKTFPNLEELHIGYTAATSLKELSELSKLRVLEVDSVTDNSYLSALSGLESLTIRGNAEKSDYSVLFGMPGLRELNLEDARGLKNIDFVSNMPNLEQLSINDSQIRDIEALRGHQNLKRLSLVENGEIRDYSLIESLISLEELRVNLRWGHQDVVFPMLGGLPSLRKLDITEQWLNRIGGNQNLEELAVMCPLARDTDLAILVGLDNLSSLRLYGDGNPLHIKALAACPKLRKISIEEVRIHYENELADLFNIPSLEYLEFFDMGGFKVRSDAVADNETLKYLYIDKGEYVDTETQSNVMLGDVADVFAKLHAMEELTIMKSGISDLGFVREMPRLRYLDISDNYVSDVSPLAENAELRVLVCRDNSIANADVLSGEVLIIR